MVMRRTKPTEMSDVILTQKDLVPEKDYDLKKAGIISQIVNKRIRIVYQAGTNCVVEGKDKGEPTYIISKASPKIKGISGNVAINHELAHVLFYSFDPRAIKTIDTWSKEWTSKDMAYRTYFEAYNIIEDQRIESMWGKIYLGNKIEFEHCRKTLGKPLTFSDSPSGVLLAERFFRQDLIKGKYANVATLLHDVEGKELRATMIVLNTIKPYLDEIIKKAEKQHDDYKEVRKVYKQSHEKTSALRNERTTDPYKIQKSMEEETELNKECSDLLKKIHKNDTKYKEISGDQHRNQEMKNTWKEHFIKEYSDDELSTDGLDKLEEEAKQKLETVKDQLAGNGEGSLRVAKKTVYKPIDRKSKSPITIDDKWIKQIRKILRMFKEKETQVISSEGHDLDIGAYINMKAQGYGECLVEDTRKDGLSICLSVDGSGSMRNYNRNTVVQQICGTIFKAIEDSSNIDLKCITWTSDRVGDVQLKQYETFEDLQHLDSQPLGYTPTHLGITVGSDVLSKMKGKRKLMIVITDGNPLYNINGRRVATDVILKQTIKAWKMALKKTPNMMIIGVGWSHTYLQQIFKDKFISCATIEDVEKFMMKTIKKEIIGVMSR
tara:strand:+ start:2019 stop:3836 length:1818 start_codon:yes stop_codon:yes gene_type:complete